MTLLPKDLVAAARAIVPSALLEGWLARLRNKGLHRRVHKGTMKAVLAYRTIVVLVSLLFLLFTAGLPLMVEYCTSTGTPAGCACGTGCCASDGSVPGTGPFITGQPCCVSSPAVHAAQPEFESVKTGAIELSSALTGFATTPSGHAPAAGWGASFRASASPLPLHADDIPVFTSSLLL